MSNEVLFLLMAAGVLAFHLLAFRLGLGWLLGLIVADVVMANIFVTKGMIVFGFEVTGGNVVYAAIFFGTDLLSEFYGPRTARRAVWLGFLASVMFVLCTQFILAFEPAPYDEAQSALAGIFTLTPRIVASSMVAYLISQNLDIWLFDAIRRLTAGRHLWLRNNGSTWISQAVDSTIFTLLAFWGVFPNLAAIIVFTYVVKIVVAAMDTPVIYLAKRLGPVQTPAGGPAGVL